MPLYSCEHYIDHLISHFCLSAELFIFYPCFVSFVNHQCLKGSRRPVPINRAPSQADESIREMFPDCYCLCPCDSLKIHSEKSVLKSCGIIRGDGLILMAVEAASVKGTRWLQMEN